MPLTRPEKEQMVSDLAEVFSTSQVGFLVDYRGLTVAEVTELRRQLWESQIRFRVLKNRIAKRAVQDTPFEPLAEDLTEPRALVYGYDMVAPAKVLSKYLEGNQKLRYVNGVVVSGDGGRMLSDAQLRELSRLPGRDELMAQFLGLLKTPQGQFVRLLNEIPAKFVRTLAALRDARERGEA